MSPDDKVGIVCVSPNGNAFTLVRVGDENAAFPIQLWQMELDRLNFSIAPLVFRQHAVVALDADGRLGIIQSMEEGFPKDEYGSILNWQESFDDIIRDVGTQNYLDIDGNYSLLQDDGECIRMHWLDVHNQLLPLGIHIIVKKNCLPSRFTPRLPSGDNNYLLGWLRYPDESDIDFKRNDLVFVAFRVIDRNSNRRSDMEDVDIIGFNSIDCIVFATQRDILRTACDDFLYV